MAPTPLFLPRSGSYGSTACCAPNFGIRRPTPPACKRRHRSVDLACSRRIRTRGQVRWGSKVTQRRSPPAEWQRPESSRRHLARAGRRRATDTFYAWLPGRIHAAIHSLFASDDNSSLSRRRTSASRTRLPFTNRWSKPRSRVFFVADADDAERLIQAWEMPRGKDLLQEEIVGETSGESALLTDIYPPSSSASIPLIKSCGFNRRADWSR